MLSSSKEQRSAFDALMSNARAAAAYKKSKPSFSPKKRKTLTLNSKNSIYKKPKLNPGLDSEWHESKKTLVPKSSISEKTKTLGSELNKKLRVDESITQLKVKPVKFDPKTAAYWGEGESVPFLFLARVFDEISKESGRIVITEILCNMLRTVIYTTPQDLVAVLYLTENRIAPLGIGELSILKALEETCGATETHINKRSKPGDLGLAAKASRSSQPLMSKPKPLTVSRVFDTFSVIAKESGKDSQDKKKNHIKGLLVSATDCEPQYMIQLLQRKLRIGLAEQSLLTALGHAFFYTEKHPSPPANTDLPLDEAAKIVKQVYSVIPVYEKIVPALLSSGVWHLPKTCCFTPGVPVEPMLAKPIKRVSEILDKFQNMEFTCEYKYDGERAQIHYLEDGTVQIYSRKGERNTEKFPDVVVAASRVRKSNVTTYVLDCELVAYDRKKQKILPFQILSTRARKNVVMCEIKVEVCIYAFDLLYLNGQQLLQEQLCTHRQRLYESFTEELGYFQFATAMRSSDLEEIQTFLDASVNASCEGLIIKTLTQDATYEPAKRSNNWLKLKKDYMDSIGDSLDLVPIAAFEGKGRRAGCYGAFLLACYDSNKDEYQTICKIGSGFSDAMLEELSTRLRSKEIPNPKVWEVKAADLTISPVYYAAMGVIDPNKGISIRFPRLHRLREDKGPKEASSSHQIADMYNAQKHTQDNGQDDIDPHRSTK